MDMSMESTSQKTSSRSAVSKDMELQVCVCGWSKATTVRGLKIHQGRMKCLREKGQGPRIDQYFLRSQSSQSNEIQRQEANHSSQDISTPVIDVRRTCMDTVSDEPNDPCEPVSRLEEHLKWLEELQSGEDTAGDRSNSPEMRIEHKDPKALDLYLVYLLGPNPTKKDRDNCRQTVQRVRHFLYTSTSQFSPIVPPLHSSAIPSPKVVVRRKPLPQIWELPSSQPPAEKKAEGAEEEHRECHTWPEEAEGVDVEGAEGA
ncbi:UNVERIFIED_CONTAM: hypothetical protein FKN15_010539 [Acipenser sinensis]